MSTFENPTSFQAFLLPLAKRAFTNSTTDVTERQKLELPIHFQFLPEITTDSMSAEYSTIGDALGRSEQFQIYKNSSNRGITLKTQFVARGGSEKHYSGRDSAGKIESAEWVQHQVHRIMALTKPIYAREDFGGSKDVFSPPPLVLLTHGIRFICTPCVVTQVNISTPDGTGIQTVSALPLQVDIEIQMKTAYPYGYIPGYLNLNRAYRSVVRQETIEEDEAGGRSVIVKYNTDEARFGTVSAPEGIVTNTSFNDGTCSTVLLDFFGTDS